MLWGEADGWCGCSLGSRARPWWSYDGVVEVSGLQLSITTASLRCCVRSEALQYREYVAGSRME